MKLNIKLNKKLKEFTELKHFKKIFLIIAALVVFVLIFSAGVFVGIERARFSYGWGEHYYNNFVGKRGLLRDRDYINAHGVVGEIIKIDGNNIIIKGEDNVERTVIAPEQTVIRSRRENLKLTDLKVGDKIVVIGSPNNQGQVEAKFIRASGF